jgi:hypothetical protein
MRGSRCRETDAGKPTPGNGRREQLRGNDRLGAGNNGI